MLDRFSPGTLGRAIASPEEAGESVVVLVIEYHRDLRFSSDVHTGFELAILTAGTQERYAPGCGTEMVPGDVFLSPAWEPHGWRNLTEYTRVVNVHFLPEFLRNEEFAGESWLSMFACSLPERPQVQGDEIRAKVLTIAQELSAGPAVLDEETWPLDGLEEGRETVVMTRRWIRRDNAGLPLAWEEETRLSVLRLLLLLFRGWSSRHRAKLQRLARPSHLAQIMPAIRRAIPHKDRARRMYLRDAACACNLSLTTFRRCFRRTMGVTFGRFELHQRAALAERLLLTTDLPLAAIAERCDFTDVSHFHRTFAKLYGQTPGRYRDLTRKGMS